MSTTELELRGQPAGDVALAVDPADDLIVWARAAHQAHEIALQLAETSFVPKSMFRKPGEVTGCILAGRELGLSPMSALASIDIIDGTPALRAHALRGLLLANGHEVWVEESNETRAIVCAQRRRNLLSGSPARVERSTWTLDRAKKAGLAGKKNWLTHPTAMLVARATAEVCRRVAADVLLGMPYSAEELDDGVDPSAPDPGETPPPAPRKARSAQRAAPAEPVPVPPADVDFDAPPAAPPPDPPADEPPRDACLEEGTAQSCPDYPPDDEAVAVGHLEAAGFQVEVIEEPRPVERAGWPEPAPIPEPADEPKLSDAQRRRLGVEFRQAGITDRAERLGFAARVVGRALESSNDLTVSEATAVIRALADPEPEPPAEEP